MAEPFDTVVAPEEDRSKNRLWIIVAVVAIVLLCCCCVAAVGAKWLWDNGDQLLEELGLVFQMTHLLL